MRIVTVVTSKGKNQQIKTDVSNWKGLVNELESAGLDVEGMKAIVGGLNVTLESAEAVLPTNDFTLFLSPVKIKAGFANADYYEFEWEADDVEDLSYTDLRTELKSIRTQASELEDDDMLELIGNYTHDSVSALKEKLTRCYESVVVEEEIEESSTQEMPETSLIVDEGLKTLVFEVAHKVGVRTDYNADDFDARNQSELERIMSTI